MERKISVPSHARLRTRSFLRGSTLLIVLLVVPVRAQWELVWEDDFDGTDLDLSRWTFERGDGCPDLCGWGNGELEYYRAENATVADGLLTISAREESIMGRDYTSSRLRTLEKGDWKYGRFEMRARMPQGRGLWPAFWMLPTDGVYGGWAASGEIDILEHWGHEPSKIHGTLHYGGEYPSNRYSSRTFALAEGVFADGFHVFAVEWEPEEIRWYADGENYHTLRAWSSSASPFPAPFDQRFHILLNVAVGGGPPGPPNEDTVFPQALVIDYVRVYQDAERRRRASPPNVSLDAALDGAGLTLAATAGTADGVIQMVEFLQGGAVVATDVEEPYELALPDVSDGCYSFAARATDRDGLVPCHRIGLVL